MPFLKASAALLFVVLGASASTSLAAQTGAVPSLQSPDVQPAPQASNPREQQLIDNVEKAYQSGLDNLRAGHAAAARQSFDYAVDQLLTSGLDIKTHPALSAELDRVVDSINTIELDALRQGGAGQAAEPTPVDIANDVTFPVDPNVKAQAIEELRTTQSDLPLVINDYVASFINFFSNSQRGRSTITLSLERAGRYKSMIQRILKEEGVPQDLVYQAVAESGFRPQAYNPRSGAAGMWQFMPYGTYGLAKTGWYDERFDPEKATRAYAREMKKAYNQLGDWYLAMAAYDWGTGNVQRAVQRTGYVDFWELYRRNNLPQETKNYVPIILAVAIMAKNPSRYGLDSVTADSPIVPDTVSTDYAIQLKLVADLTDSSLDLVNELNPSLLRGETPPGEPYELHLPAGTRDLYEKRVAEIPADKRTTWRFHRVAPGETLEAIARNFHTTASDIAFVNQLGPAEDLANVDALVIPAAPPAPVYSYSSASVARTSVYKVHKGDTLVTIADRFGVAIADLREWNHLGGRVPQAGQKLYVSAPVHISRASKRGGRAVRAGRVLRVSAVTAHTTRAAGAASHRAVAALPHSHSLAKTAHAHGATRRASRR